MTAGPAGAALELDDIQSEIVRGYRRTDGDDGPKHAIYLLVRFDLHAPAEPRMARARAFVRDLDVTFARGWVSREVHVNVGFTYRGLTEACGLSPDLLRSSLFAEMVETMAARSALLGDLDDSRSATWAWSDATARREAHFDDVHMVVMIFGPDPGAVRDKAVEIEAKASQAGAQVLRQEGTELAERREHFGFVDGISQPAIRGLEGSAVGHGAVTADGGFRHIAAGELVLGYDDEAAPWADAPILRNGSFFVLRKIEQHVRAFHDYLFARSLETHKEAGWLASRIMGRTFDGAPILGEGAQSRSTRDPEQRALEYHDFIFSQDAIGFECPHGAHIRRANPRDALNRPGDRAERHRLARRTLMYAEDAEGTFLLEPGSRAQGDALRRGETIEDDAKPIARGMLFGAFNASIRRQFEIVQGEWLAGGGANPTKLFTFPDPLTGAHSGSAHYVIPGRPTTVLGHLQRFVTTRAGAYFFVPGREALRTIALDPAAANRVSRHVPSSTESLAARVPSPPRASLLVTGLSRIKSALRGRPSRAASEPIVGGVPEEQVLVLLAPILEPDRVKRALADESALDEVFAAIGGEGRRRVHHARFAYVEDFKQFPEDPSSLETERVPLPDGRPYLFFVCWFDGARADLVRALVALEERLPFRYCSAYARGLEAFIELYAVEPRFVYRAYPASTSTIRKALEIRLAFTTMLQRMQSSTVDKRQQLLELFREHRAAFEED